MTMMSNLVQNHILHWFKPVMFYPNLPKYTFYSEGIVSFMPTSGGEAEKPTAPVCRLRDHTTQRTRPPAPARARGGRTRFPSEQVNDTGMRKKARRAGGRARRALCGISRNEIAIRHASARAKRKLFICAEKPIREIRAPRWLQN